MCPKASHLLRDPRQDVASYSKLLMTFRMVERQIGSLVVRDERCNLAVVCVAYW